MDLEPHQTRISISQEEVTWNRITKDPYHVFGNSLGTAWDLEPHQTRITKDPHQTRIIKDPHQG